MKLAVLDLFSGIGGFSLGLERATLEGAEYDGFETVAFCEIEPFPRKVLAKHWPGVPCYTDVRELTSERLAADGIAVDVITGGFPCQDISVAGNQAGITDGTRSGLWSEIDRLVGELRPAFVIVENVANLLAGPSEQPGGWFGRVLGDLAERGYDAEWENIPAAALGAPHRRERIWLVAYPHGAGYNRAEQPRILGAPDLQGPSDHACNGSGAPAVLAYANGERLEGWAQSGNAYGLGQGIQQLAERCPDCFGGIWRTEPNVGRVANGVPDRAHRLKALGNAVVPQIPELIGRAILAALHRPLNSGEGRPHSEDGSPVSPSFHSPANSSEGQDDHG